MSLSPQERLILATCEMEADLTISEVSKRSGIVEHIVRRVLGKLHDSAVVTRRLYMNSFLLGTTPYIVVFSLSPAGQNMRGQLHAHLLAQPHVGFVADVSGSYNLFCEVRAESLFALKDFLEQVSKLFGPIFQDKEILALTSMNDFL